ncbi:hypothetical protein CRM22_001107 [Opisthorchis felineus]|uniref:Sodium/calcium exchanger membrane region domain-containing protein n=1 Tax=Opisthorchis felineus TaxID=147828 RepID=A0A4S2MC25_OPIFE|nr:hypothetical protein CRM22_001107 [Opisthorchis felineus]
MRNLSEVYGSVRFTLSLQDDLPYCVGWLSLPADNAWPQWLRIMLYVTGLLYLFVGIAVMSDIFMFSIERITSEKRLIRIYDDSTGALKECSVFVWNETVANLTLMALGSSAPEILLACIEAVKAIVSPTKEPPDSLGLFTILGSAAFNLFAISGICIVSVTSPQTKRIEKFGVFILTSFCSLFAYAWMLLITVFISPNEIELWEAGLTFLFFPMMVLMAFTADKQLWSTICSHRSQSNTSEMSQPGAETLGDSKSHHSKQDKNEDVEFRDLSLESQPGPVEGQPHKTGFRYVTTARFSRMNQYSQRISNEIAIDGLRKQHFGWAYFSCPTYMVSAGAREVSCLVHFQRHHVTSETGSKTLAKSCTEGNSKSLAGERETEKSRKSLQHHSVETGSVDPRRNSTSKNSLTPTTDIFYVPFEVRPGSAQPGIHYEPISAGVLHFTGEESEQSIVIGLNVDNSVPDCSEPLDFYVILTSHHSNNLKRDKNAEDREEEQKSQNLLRVATPASPSVARILLLSSDASDCLEMQTSHYYATPDSPSVVVAVIRRGPCQQFCQVEIFTRDGTARAADENGDYLPLTKDIEFQPGVSSHLISIQLTQHKPLSHMLGCVAALKTAVTGITLVAIGTSLPDAFASRTAARLDDSADNSIGNITGSNSVNVFLGLGVPWLFSAIDATIRGKRFCVSTSGVCEASMLFLGMALLCLGNLICRRKVFAGELGGPVCSKWIAGLGCITLWIIYVLVLSLRAYDVIGWNINVPSSSCGTTGK